MQHVEKYFETKHIKNISKKIFYSKVSNSSIFVTLKLKKKCNFVPVLCW